jgi:hypothetical protein
MVVISFGAADTALVSPGKATIPVGTSSTVGTTFIIVVLP